MTLIVWQTPPDRVCLQAAYVDLWFLNLENCSHILPSDEILDLIEKDRANQFLRAEDRHRFIHAHVMMRDILSRYLDISPASIVYGTLGQQKPILKNHELAFNLSHSHHGILLGVSKHSYLGVDLEFCNRKINLLEIAQRFFSSAETDHLLQLDSRDQEDAFFQLWTLKEAYVKATGEGIARAFSKISFNRDLFLPVGAVQSCLDCHRVSFQPIANYWAAIVASSSIETCHYYRYTPVTSPQIST